MRADHTCADHEPELSALLDGRLSAGSARRLRRHLATCRGCRAELEEFRRARSLLRSLPVREVPAGLFTQSTLDPEAPATLQTSPPPTWDVPAAPRAGAQMRSAATVLAVAATVAGVMMALSGGDLIVPIEVDVATLALGHESVASAAGVPMPVAGGASVSGGFIDPSGMDDDGAATLLSAAMRGSQTSFAGETLVMTWPLGPDSPAEVSGAVFSVTGIAGDHALADPTHKYDIIVGQVEHIMDRPCLRIDLRLADVDELREQVWIDETTGVFLRRETFEGGERRRSVSYRSLDLDAVSVGMSATPPDIEALSLRDPAQVAALRAGGWDIPEELPGRYRLVGASVQAHLSGMPVQAIYSDGLYVTSLFLQPGQLDLDVVAGSAEHVDELTDRLAYVWPELPSRMIWATAGHTYTLIGDAPLDDLTAMAAGLAAG